MLNYVGKTVGELMKTWITTLLCLTLALGAVFAGSTSVSVENQDAFSSPAAQYAFTTGGDMSVSTDISQVAESLLNGESTVMARTGGCTVSCTNKCTNACTNTCTTRCN